MVFDFFHNPSRVYQLLIGETDFGMTPSRSYYLRPGSVLYFTGEHYSGTIFFFILQFLISSNLLKYIQTTFMASGQETKISSQTVWRMWASLMLNKEALSSEGKEYLVSFGLRGSFCTQTQKWKVLFFPHLSGELKWIRNPIIFAQLAI